MQFIQLVMRGLNRAGKIYGPCRYGLQQSFFIWMLLRIFLSTFHGLFLLHGSTFLEFGGLLLWKRKGYTCGSTLYFWFACLNGFTLSFIIVQYTRFMLSVFLSTAIVFFFMALIGVTIKRDRQAWPSSLMAALIEIIVASLINIFASSMMSFVISIVSILIFSGLPRLR